jgi:phage-related minor tail protein
MATQVASLFGVLSLEDKQFQSGLKSADTGLKNTADRMKSFGDGVRNTGVLLMGAATPILAFGAAAINSAGESQLAVSQLNAVIESTGGVAGVTADHATALADSLQSVTRFSDESVLAGQNMLLTFTNIGAAGGVFDLATKTALDMSTALGGDVSQSAMQLGKALNDPINGITALQRVGVTFTEAQKEQIAAMVEAGDVAGAQTLILQELQREFGGSAVAAGQTFPGQMDIMKNKMDEINEAIGNILIPALGEIVTAVGPIIDKIVEWIQQNPELVKNIGIVAIGAFALGGILTILGTAIGLVSGAIGILLSPAVLLIAAIAGIIYAADKLYPGGISKMFDDARVAATQLAALGFGALMIAANWARDRLTEFITTVQNVINKVDELKNRLSAGVTGITGIAGGLANGQFSIGDVITATINEFKPKAMGGPVSGGMPYLVGEQGPELFTPGSSGNISTASETAGMMGGINIGTININASTYEGGRAAGRGFMDAVKARGG